jgi:hypothetical protein
MLLERNDEQVLLHQQILRVLNRLQQALQLPPPPPVARRGKK